MGDFNDRNEAITLEDYRAMDARGEITRPLTWPRIRLRAEHLPEPTANQNGTRTL